MELDDRALPLTCEQRDIWLAQHASHAGTECQLGLFARIEGTVDLDLPEQASRQALQEPLSVQRAPMPVSGLLFKSASLQTQTDEFYLLDWGEHARLDAWRNRAMLPQPANAVGRPLVGHV
jgi:hypothetical protein